MTIDEAIKRIEALTPEWTAWELRSRRRRTAFVMELSRLDGDTDVFVTGHGTTPQEAILAAIEKAGGTPPERNSQAASEERGK